MKTKIGLIHFVILIGLFVLISVLVTTTLTKYVFDDENNNVIVSEDFIFISNYIDGKTYDIKRDNLNIVISNSSVSGVNKEDIKFDIEIKNKNSNNIVKSYNNQILIGSTNSSLEFDFTNLTVGESYVVTINSTMPIKKTIKHQFNIVEETSIDSYYTIKDKGAWVELDIYIGTNKINQLEVIYSSALAADNTNQLTSDWFGTSGELLNLKENSHYQLIFFKNDNELYDPIEKGEIIDNQIVIN